MVRKFFKNRVWLGVTLLGGTIMYFVLRHLTSPQLSSNNMTHEYGQIRYQKKATNATTTPVPGMEYMTAAAAKLKTVCIPSDFRYSNNMYFHQPDFGRTPNVFQYLISPVDVCSGREEPRKESPFLLVLALSSYLNTSSKEREAIRRTYGSVAKGNPWPSGKPLAAPVGMVFVLGRPPTRQHRQELETESARYGDVLMADFVDSYRNLTLKVLLGLRWVLQHCPQTRFVLKADEDVFVNLPLLTAFLVSRGHNDSVYGHPYYDAVVGRKGRWGVSRTVYPVPRYPVYMSGTSYVLSTDAVLKLVQASDQRPRVPIEDAFITGILAHIMAVRRISCEGFTFFREKRPHDCEFVNDRRLVGNEMHADQKMGLWLTLSTDYLIQACLV